MTSKELREQRLALVVKARKILESAEAEKREISAEEQAQWETINAEIDTLKGQIDKAEKDAMRARLDAEERDMRRPAVVAPRPTLVTAEHDRLVQEVRQRLGEFDHLSPALRADFQRRMTPEYIADFRHWLREGEHRAMLATSDAHGGYLAPPSFLAQLQVALDDVVSIRGRATVVPVTSGVSLGCPTLTDDLDDAGWTSESPASLTYDDMRVGLRELRPHPLIKGIKVSRKLLRASSIPVDQLVANRFAVRFGRAEEQAFMTGSGVGQPLGLFTASSDGIPTSRDVPAADDLTFCYPDIVNLIGKVKQQYRPNSVFVAHRDIIKTLRLIQDGDSRYIWTAGAIAGQPDMLMGYPVIESEFAPSTIAATNYTMVFGNLQFYWIADSLGLEIVMTDKYLENGLNAYIGFAEVDGMPIDANAFSRLQMTAN